MIKAKLYMNVHWMVLYNLKVFCSGMKFKMAATAKVFEISANQSILLALAAMLNIRLERKKSKFVEDHPRNIPAKFGSNWPSGFGEEA
jgi:hypothetical protein